jgi:16S rRNA (guanine527-N7)-methyltransferase
MTLEKFKYSLEFEIKNRKLKVTEEQIKKFVMHFGLLLKWQKTHNLTSIIDVEKAVYMHYLDCILGLNAINPKEQLMDLGSGAGFPGIIAAILWPKTKCTLLESVRKKCSFLTEVKKLLNLDNVTVLNERLENVQDIDCGITRAAFSIDKIDLIAKSINKKGELIVFLGPIDSMQENIIKLKNFNVEQINKYYLHPGTDIEYMRTLVLLVKK